MSEKLNFKIENKSLRELEKEKTLAETKQNKEILKEDISQGIINKLNSKEWYIVKQNDILSLINKLTSKGNHIKFYKEWDKIWPNDIITIEWWKVYRSHKWEKVVVGDVESGFDKKTVNDETVDENEAVNDETVDENEAVNDETIDDTPVVETGELEYERRYIIEDGRIFLIWPDWKKTDYQETLTPEDKEKIKQYEQLMILNEVLEIWKSEALNISNSLHWKDSRNDYEIILEQIDEVNNLFWQWYTEILKWNDISSIINNVFEKINIAEDEEFIIWDDDMKKVKEVLLDSSLNKDTKLQKIFNLMRYKWLSWNTNQIKEKVSNHLLQDKNFSDIKDILSNPNLVSYIENNNTNKLEKLVWKENVEKILEAYKKLRWKHNKYRDEYTIEYNELVSAWKINTTEIDLNKYIDLKAYASTLILLKHTLLRQKVEKMEIRWNEDNSYTWLYANISWLAGMKWIWDLVTISDNNIDTAIDVWSTLAISAVSMWVWALAARWAMAAATWWAKTLTLTDRVNKLRKGAGLAKFAWTAWVEWVAFYEWSNLTHNLIYWENWINWAFDNTTNWKEILKSIAFMWVLRWVWKFMWTTAGVKMSSVVPSNMLKTKTTIWILSEAWLLTWTSVWLEIAFEWEWHWSWEEYLQALVMVGLFRGISKITFSKADARVQDPNVAHSEAIKIEIERTLHTEAIQENINRWRVQDVEIAHTEAMKIEIERTLHAEAIQENINRWRVQDVEIAHTEATKMEIERAHAEALKIEANRVHEEAIIENNHHNALIENSHYDALKINKTIDYFWELITKETSRLIKWESINIWEYTITRENKVVGSEYKVEKWDYKKNFKTPQQVAKALNGKIEWHNIKTEIIINLWRKDINKKLKRIKGEEIIAWKKTYRIKEENWKYRVQEKNWQDWFKEVKIEKLTIEQSNKILETIVGSKWLWFLRNWFNFLSKWIPRKNIEKLLSNVPEWKTKKAITSTLESIGKKWWKWLKNSKDVLMWILRWNKEGNTSMFKDILWSSAKWKAWISAWVIWNELWDVYANWQTWDETFTLWNWWEMLFNAVFTSQVGWLRSIIFNELSKQWIDYVFWE